MGARGWEGSGKDSSDHGLGEGETRTGEGMVWRADTLGRVSGNEPGKGGPFPLRCGWGGQERSHGFLWLALNKSGETTWGPPGGHPPASCTRKAVSRFPKLALASQAPNTLWALSAY